VQAVNGFNTTQDAISGNTRCGDHGYSLLARAAASYAAANGITGACAATRSGESCTGASAWTWTQNNVPFFNQAVAAPSTSCGTSNKQIKFALAMRPSAGGPVCIISTSTPLPDGQVNTAYSQTISTSGCASPTFSVNAGLPGGLGLNTSTGLISGIPTQSGPASLTVSVADANGNPSQLYTLTINAALARSTSINGKASISGNVKIH